MVRVGKDWQELGMVSKDWEGVRMRKKNGRNWSRMEIIEKDRQGLGRVGKFLG